MFDRVPFDSGDRTREVDKWRASLTLPLNKNTVGTIAVDVHNADFHNSILNVHFTQDQANTDTLNQAASAGDSTIEVDNSSQYSANDFITIIEGTVCESDVLKVIGSDGTDPGTLTLDRPLENAYTTTSTVIAQIDIDFSNGNGSIASPDTYQIAPPSDEVWHITTLSIMMMDAANPVIEKFSGIAGLTNGVVIRSETTDLGNRNHVVLRTNGDLREYFGGAEIDIQQKAAGGDYMISGLWHLKEHSDAIIRLDGSKSDVLKLIAQDNLTAITEAELVAFGHKEGE